MSRLLPPEWAPQSATILAWPAARDHADAHHAAGRDTVAAMAAALTPHQRVLLLARDAEARETIAAHPLLANAERRLRIVDCPTDDIWARDFGPLTVRADGGHECIDFRFDGWGGRYPAGRDDRATARLHETGVLGARRLIRDPHVLEGGSIEVNGAGSLLTTRSCLIDHSRNRGMNAADFQVLFRERLGIEHIHWLGHGALAGDDTDGHIDTLARFVAADTIVHQSCDDPADSHHAPLAAMAAELRALRDRHGQPYRLVPLPLPAPLYDPENGRRLPAGYANFLVANGCVLVPAYDDPADEPAAAVLARCFPGRRIVPIDCRALIRHNGALHCAAMQLPAHG